MGIMTNGVQQWVFQRVSNAVFVIFGIVLLINLLDGGLSYETLTAMLANTGFKVYLAITLVFAAVNSVLAGWQITGDYAEKFGIPPFLMMGVTILVSVGYLVFGLLHLF